MRRLMLILIVVFSFLIVAFGALQIRHYSLYGHFFPLGLHADVTVSDGDASAHLTNFGLFAKKVEQCEFLSDAGAHGVSIPYRLEQLDKGTENWKTLFDTAGVYCRPYPLLIAQPRVVSKRLWPGQTISTQSRATAAGENLRNETMRFVIEAAGREFPTGPYMILEVEQGLPHSP